MGIPMQASMYLSTFRAKLIVANSLMNIHVCTTMQFYCQLLLFCSSKRATQFGVIASRTHFPMLYTQTRITTRVLIIKLKQWAVEVLITSMWAKS